MMTWRANSKFYGLVAISGILALLILMVEGITIVSSKTPEYPADPGDVINVIPQPGPNGQGLTWDGQYLWVSDISTDLIYKLDPVDGAILDTIPSPGDCVEGLAWEDIYLWGSVIDPSNFCEDGGPAATVNKLDPTTGSTTAFVSAPGSSPWPHGITFDGSALWVNDFVDKVIFKIDPTNGAILASIPAPGDKSIGLAWDGQTLWSGDFGTNLLYRISPVDGTIDQTLPSPATNPRDMTWDGAYLWVIAGFPAQIYQIDVGGPLVCGLPSSSPSATIHSQIFGETFDYFIYLPIVWDCDF